MFAVFIASCLICLTYLLLAQKNILLCACPKKKKIGSQQQKSIYFFFTLAIKMLLRTEYHEIDHYGARGGH